MFSFIAESVGMRHSVMIQILLPAVRLEPRLSVPPTFTKALPYLEQSDAKLKRVVVTRLGAALGTISDLKLFSNELNFMLIVFQL